MKNILIISFFVQFFLSIEAMQKSQKPPTSLQHVQLFTYISAKDDFRATKYVQEHNQKEIVMLTYNNASALFYAVEYGVFECAHKLLEVKADANYRSPEGISVLQKAMDSKKNDLILSLIKAGASFSAKELNSHIPNCISITEDIRSSIMHDVNLLRTLPVEKSGKKNEDSLPYTMIKNKCLQEADRRNKSEEKKDDEK